MAYIYITIDWNNGSFLLYFFRIKLEITSVIVIFMLGNQQCPNCQYQCMDPVELHRHMNKVYIDYR